MLVDDGAENASYFNSLPAILVSVSLWLSSYGVSRRLFSNQTPEFSSRIVALIHGTLVAALGMSDCVSYRESPFYHPEWETTSLESFIIVCSLGYFIYDLGWCLYYNTETKLMICHHIYSTIALFRLLGKVNHGPQAACGLGVMEITNPFLQARWFIRTAGLYPSWIFTIVEMIFMILFVALRIIIGSYYVFIIAVHPLNDWEFILLTCAIYLLSFMFFMSIMKYVVMKRKKKEEKKREEPAKE